MERRNFLTWTGAGAGTLTAGVLGTSPAGAAESAAPHRTRPLRVHIVMFDGAEDLDFAAPFEVFCGAGLIHDVGVETRYVALDARRYITSSYGTRIRVDHRWDPREADVLVVPGGGYTHRQGPGVWAEIADGRLVRALAAAPRRGLTISSLCTGAILLAAAGLTEGRPCTTHHGAAEELRSRGGVVTDARVVDDADLVTAGGITSGLELGLWLVRRELGAETAVALEGMLEYQARGTVWVPEHRR